MSLGKRIFRKYWKTIILVLLVLVIIRFLGERINSQEIVMVIQKAGIWGPVVITLLMASTFIAAPLSSMPFLIGGYLVFGQNILLYHYLGSILAAVVDFWIARIWGREIVTKMVGEKNMDKVDKFAQKQSLKTLILLRVFQFQMHDVISYGIGLTEIKFGPYLLASIFGPFVWFTVWYLFIHGLVYNLKDFLFWFSVSYLPFWLISIFLVIWWKTNKKNYNP